MNQRDSARRSTVWVTSGLTLAAIAATFGVGAVARSQTSGQASAATQTSKTTASPASGTSSTSSVGSGTGSADATSGGS